MTAPMFYFIFQDKTAFIPLKYVYPECSVLIKDHTRVEPLQCYAMECPANKNCAEIMAKRIYYLFDNVIPQAELLVLYFNFRNSGFTTNQKWVPSLGAGIFYRNFKEPRWSKINRWGFNKCKADGQLMSWIPSTEFLLMGGSNDIIPMENLLRHD